MTRFALNISLCPQFHNGSGICNLQVHPSKETAVKPAHHEPVATNTVNTKTEHSFDPALARRKPRESGEELALSTKTRALAGLKMLKTS